MEQSPLNRLAELGQSIWIDDIGRDMLEDGRLRRLIAEDAVTGLTSNPAIFAQSMMHDAVYRKAAAELCADGRDSVSVYETLALEDLRRAADLLLPTFTERKGADGFVSWEVSPHLAHDAARTIAEGKRLWKLLERRNAMIKVPGTQAGLVALRALIDAGVNVNVTLLFSPARYAEVAEAFFAGLEARIARGDAIDQVASVASFFLSRIDTQVDARLDELTRAGRAEAAALRGKAAVSQARAAFQIFESQIASARWKALAEKGGRPQRLLWASTSAKDKAYSPVKYVDELAAANTVNTMPLATLEAYRAAGKPRRVFQAGTTADGGVKAGLAELGIDLEAVARELEAEGVQKFIEPYAKIQSWLAAQGCKLSD